MFNKPNRMNRNNTQDVMDDIKRRCQKQITAYERAFLSDLGSAIQLRTDTTEGLGRISWAPYIDPILTGNVRPVVEFPNVENGYGPSFAFLARPLSVTGEESTIPLQRNRTLNELMNGFYGVPIWIGEVVSLEESGLLDRKIGSLRLGEGFKEATDALSQLILSTGPITRVNQDIIVDLTLGNLLELYQQEDDQFNREGIMVQRVRIVVPTSGEYKTECALFAAQKDARFNRNHMCYGYSVGDRLYRGRPVLNSNGGGLLLDVNTTHQDSYFSGTSMSTVRDGVSKGGEVQEGNIVVMAMPVIGAEAPVLSLFPSFGSSDIYGGGATRGFSGSTMMGLDSLALSTGRATGSSSRVTTADADINRRVGIIDAQVLALTPEEMPYRLRDLASH